MHIGIDLGTTYCCVAYIDDHGTPTVIPSTDGEPTTPSVIWFDGRQAFVGAKANLRKQIAPQHVYEFVKRDIGRPVEIPPELYRDGDPSIPSPAPYEVDGFKYGAAGMSAIILRKLKKDAVQHFKRIGRLDRQLDEKSLELDAVITVPAYFGDKERQETKLAGYAAGLNVIGIINEPTAAALSYGRLHGDSRRVMVFDLGGGTFDVTILEMRGDEAEVLASGGDNTLGGKDWDEIIQAHLHAAFRAQNGRDIPDDHEQIFQIQQLALRAKLELSEREEAHVFHSIADVGDLDVTLHRSAPADADSLDVDAVADAGPGGAFHFEERASHLLYRCRVLCELALAQVQLPTPGGGTRPMTWEDLDEIVLAGGSCRMPMVPRMLERISGHPVRRQIKGFDYDTAIALGAALYGQRKGRVRDVVSHSVGVKVVKEGRHAISHLIRKNTPLPARAERTFRAGPRAMLSVYEGESYRPDECIERGRLELGNADGTVTVALEADANGTLTATADYPQGRKVLQLKNELYLYDERAAPLRAKVQSLHVNV